MWHSPFNTAKTTMKPLALLDFFWYAFDVSEVCCGLIAIATVCFTTKHSRKCKEMYALLLVQAV